MPGVLKCHRCGDLHGNGLTGLCPKCIMSPSPGRETIDQRDQDITDKICNEAVAEASGMKIEDVAEKLDRQSMTASEVVCKKIKDTELLMDEALAANDNERQKELSRELFHLSKNLRSIRGLDKSPDPIRNIKTNTSSLRGQFMEQKMLEWQKKIDAMSPFDFYFERKYRNSILPVDPEVKKMLDEAFDAGRNHEEYG